MILYVGGFELPEGNAASQRVINNSKLLSKLGYQIYLKGTKRFSTIGDTQSIDFDYEVSNYPRSLLDWVKYFFSISDIKRTINKIGKPNVIIAYNYPSIVMLKIMKYCRNNDIRIVSDCTEWYGFQGKNILWKMMKWLDSSINMHIINWKVDGLIVISSFLKNYYYSRNRVVLIPPLVDKNDPRWLNDYTENDIEDNNSTKILYFGSMGRKKDSISDFLRVLIINPHLVLNVVGLGKDNYLYFHPRDKKILDNLKGQVVFLGRKNHIQTLNLLKKTDFVVFFRDFRLIANRAGFPTKFVESISCLKPVITNYNMNLDNYLVSGINGIVVDNKKFTDFRDATIKLTKEYSFVLSKNIKGDTFHYENYLLQMSKFMEELGNYYE